MGKKILVFLIICAAGLFLLGYFNRDFFVSNKGIYYYKKGEYQETIRVLSKVAFTRPHHYNTAYYLTMAYWSLGRYSKADETLSRFVKENPDNLRAQANLALLKFQRGEMDKAASLAAPLITGDKRKRSPFSEAEENLARGIIFYGRGDYYAALNTLEAREDSSVATNAGISGLRGLCYCQIGLYDKAKINMESSLQAFTDNPLILAHLSALSFQLGRRGDGFYYYDRARSLSFPVSRELIKSKDLTLQPDEATSSGPALTQGTRETPGSYREMRLEEMAIEQEGVVRIPDDTAPAVAIYKNAQFGFNLTVATGGQYKILIEARGTPSNGIWPRAALSVNGIFQRRLYIRGKQWKNNPMTVHLLKGTNSLEISYINDGERLAKNEDRNLYIRRMYITKEAL